MFAIGREPRIDAGGAMILRAPAATASPTSLGKPAYPGTRQTRHARCGAKYRGLLELVSCL